MALDGAQPQCFNARLKEIGVRRLEGCGEIEGDHGIKGLIQPMQLMGRPIAVIVIAVIKPIFGAKEKARYRKYNR
jgi:hypothetical protein